MAKKYPNAPRSPYDPRYVDRMAKMDKPGFPTGVGKFAAEEQFQVRGCGDPLCMECNSHIPTEVSRRMPSNGQGVTSLSSPNNREEFERAARYMREAMGSIRQPLFMSPFAIDPSSTPADQPPRSYIEARKEIEEYLLEEEHTTAWDDVVGNQKAKDALLEAIEEPTQSPELYAYYGMTPPKGVLLYGPPGCGKTMFAKASAAAMTRVHGKKVDVIAIAGSSIQSPFIGQTESIITGMFKYAHEYKKFHGHPLVIFIDEAEVLLPDRTGRTRRVAPWEESQVATFLAEMDGMEAMGAFVILATNRPEAIDEALLRDGRCDRKIKVERPDRQVCTVILEKIFANIPTDAHIEDLVMAGTESFFNPHYVIREGHILFGSMNAEGKTQIDKDISLNFGLEHILSGAMITGLGRRAKSRAFLRDKKEKTITGVRIKDVVDSVKEIFEENKDLEHAFAVQEFIESIPVKEMREQMNQKNNLQ